MVPRDLINPPNHFYEVDSDLLKCVGKSEPDNPLVMQDGVAELHLYGIVVQFVKGGTWGYVTLEQTGELFRELTTSDSPGSVYHQKLRQHFSSAELVYVQGNISYWHDKWKDRYIKATPNEVEEVSKEDIPT